MNNTVDIVQIIDEKFSKLNKRMDQLNTLISKAINTDNYEHFISFQTIADKYNISYQAVRYKVYKYINPQQIRKVCGVNSIPKQLVHKLKFELERIDYES